MKHCFASSGIHLLNKRREVGMVLRMLVTDFEHAIPSLLECRFDYPFVIGSDDEMHDVLGLSCVNKLSLNRYLRLGDERLQPTHCFGIASEKCLVCEHDHRAF